MSVLFDLLPAQYRLHASHLQATCLEPHHWLVNVPVKMVMLPGIAFDRLSV